MKLWSLLTATQRYEKTVSTRGRGRGVFIDAPVLAYLIETPNGRILYDVGCDYSKIADPARQTRFFEPMRPTFFPPRMREDQKVTSYLQRLSLSPRDIDVIFIGHLHFDHAGGLGDLPGVEVHVQEDELAAARTGEDDGVFADELRAAHDWKIKSGEYELAPGVRAVATPGHTAGHMSLLVERLTRPVILCGDAADLLENLDDEVAPGYCYRDDENLALASIRKLKAVAREADADLWPNHDFAFFRTIPQFPEPRT